MIRSAMLVGLAFALSGCATMFNSNPTSFSARSTPEGANVIVEGLQNGDRFNGTTPETFSLSKGSDYQLTFELEGYESETILVRRSVNGWLIGSVLLGVLPAVVDFATDSMWDHTMSVAAVEFTSAAGNETRDAVITFGMTGPEGETQWVRVPVEFTQS